jgi:hypothetical protein
MIVSCKNIMDMSKVHVWIGINNSDDETFEKYFELDYNVDVEMDDPEYMVCQFCVDIKTEWYDEDMIGVYKIDHLINVEEALEEIPVSKDTLLEINTICVRKGIKKINAMFFYTDTDIKITDTDKLFNGLVYLGEFEMNI